MKLRMRIVLLGLMIWAIKFIVGGIFFAIGPPSILLVASVELFFVTITLVIALLLVQRDNALNDKRTAWETGITWYVILVLMDLITLVGFLGLPIQLLYPSIFSYFHVAIIPIIFGFLLVGPKIKA